MKVTYKFANGEISVVEVSEEIGEIIMSSRRKEHADNERHRYHTQMSLENLDYIGEELSDGISSEDEIIRAFDEEMQKKYFYEVFNQMTLKQQRRVRLRAKGLTIEKIAEMEGCDKRAVIKSLNQAKKIFENLY